MTYSGHGEFALLHCIYGSKCLCSHEQSFMTDVRLQSSLTNGGNGVVRDQWADMPQRRPAIPMPVQNERRQKARDQKLLRREIAIANQLGQRRFLCPCSICNRGLRTMLSHATITKHVRWYGYHPYQRGSTVVIARTHYVHRGFAVDFKACSSS